MLFYYIYKMTWEYDFFLNCLAIIIKCFKNSMFRTMYHLPYLLKQSPMGTQVLKNLMRLRCHFLKLFPPMC